MDVFVHTSNREPFGMVVIEAMALGKPVIAGADGGPTEIITPGVDGMLSRYGDARALSATIINLLDDDRLRRTLGAAARRRAGDFSVQQFARQFGASIAAAVRQP
jgi:glycosyltransferase involved in cell wall biosynthesis